MVNDDGNRATITTPQNPVQSSVLASVLGSTGRSFRSVIHTKIQKFFANRTPKADVVTLNLKSVYIFFSREGFLYLLLLMITFIAGINYGNNLVLGLCFYLSSIWLISVHITFSHVSGLTFKLLDVTMTEAGKPAWATIQVNNPASKPSRQISVRFNHTSYLEERGLTGQTAKEALPHSAISIMLASIQGDEVIRLPIMTSKRGQLELPRLIVSTVYPLGVMRCWSYVYFATPAWVYPRAVNFEWDTRQTLASEDESPYSHFQTKGQDDFDMLDEYQEGESLSRISWAHVARGHGMLTKHFADSVGREVTLDYVDMPASHHEQKLQQMTYAVQKMNESNQAFVMNLPNTKGEIGQGKEFTQASLLRLAKAP